jgi:hypothetical protein
MKWITREDIKVDRIACPWLIKRFVDPQAEFLFVEEKDLVEKAKLHDAIPFDAPKIAEGIGLRSIAQEFAALGISDEERLVRQFLVYDALYAYVQGT